MKYAAILLLLTGLAYAAAPDIAFKAMMEVGVPSDVTYLTGVAFDGANYYTINGGSAEYGKIAEYSNEGIFLKNIGTLLDSRGIVYAGGKVYAKDNNDTVYELKNERLERIGQYPFQTKNSKLAITPDGRYLIDHYQGKAVRYTFPGGEKVSEVQLSPPLDGYEMGRAHQIATDGYYMYFITGPKIYYYNPAGALIGTELLEQGPQSEPSLDEWSLSYTNGMVWVYKCVKSGGACTDDNLYGYKIAVPQIPPATSGGGSVGGGAAGGGSGGAIGLGGIVKPKQQAQQAAGAGEEMPAAEETAQAQPAATLQEKTAASEKPQETPGYKTPEKTTERAGNDARAAIALIAALAAMVIIWMKAQGSAKQQPPKRGQRQTGPKNRA